MLIHETIEKMRKSPDYKRLPEHEREKLEEAIDSTLFDIISTFEDAFSGFKIAVNKASVNEASAEILANFNEWTDNDDDRTYTKEEVAALVESSTRTIIEMYASMMNVFGDEFNDSMRRITMKSLREHGPPDPTPLVMSAMLFLRASNLLDEIWNEAFGLGKKFHNPVFTQERRDMTGEDYEHLMSIVEEWEKGERGNTED